MSETGPDSPDEIPAPRSEHLREFHARFDRDWREAEGTDQRLWTAVFDVAGQVSEVRHEVAHMRQSDIALDMKLFGVEDEHGRRSGGRFAILERNILERMDESDEKVVRSTSAVDTGLDNRLAEIERSNRIVRTAVLAIAGTIGTIITGLVVWLVGTALAHVFGF